MLRGFIPRALGDALVLLLFTAPFASTAVSQGSAPLPPDVAPAKMTLPEGFQATLFAGEPDIVQPIAFDFDDRGRLWVVESMAYPDWEREDHPGEDRITILEDADGDGRFDERRVFLDNGQNYAGIAVGFGGVFVCATPNFLFIPDRDHDDRPDGPPVVLLDGWDLDAKHNVFNGLTWGPDGWLYGCNGIMSRSRVGPPGTPDEQRVPLDCGVWRYHPVRQTFEVVAHGTTNPWGLDFNDVGEMFITNCVIKHLFHVTPGAHYVRMYGQDLNPYSYGLIESCADHIHWGGGPWQSARAGSSKHDEHGGGHAHVGAMVYLGDNWPDKYRNSLLTCNLHGNRVNRDVLEPSGSGYVARHAEDFLYANDTWFRGLELKYGPDGGVFVTDWCDTDECHDYEDIHRENGRIYKVTYGQPQPVRVNLRAESDMELAHRHLHDNEWFVRRARVLLQERAAERPLAEDAVGMLRDLMHAGATVPLRLRALWTLHATQQLTADERLDLLDDATEHMRAWSLRLEAEDGEAADAFHDRLVELAGSDPSALVRRHLASTLQRYSLALRRGVALKLVAHAEDADDQQIPLLIWYGVEPLVAVEPAWGVELLETSRLPVVREHIALRIAAPAGENAEPRLDPLVALLGRLENPGAQRDVLRGMQRACEGLAQVALPQGWQAVYPRLLASADGETRERAMLLALKFGDERARKDLRRVVQDENAPRELRERSLTALVQVNDTELPEILLALVEAGDLRGPSLRGLAAYNHSRTPEVILASYLKMSDAQKRDAVSTLASRPAYAERLLDAIQDGTIPTKDVSAYIARQILSFGNPKLTQKLEAVWGNVGPSGEGKQQQLDKYRKLLTDSYLNTGDDQRGRHVFQQICASCHRLFDAGRHVGPDLTGSQRANLDYILQNVLDPNSVIGKDYQAWIVETKAGRVFSGLISKETATAITLETANESVVIPKSEIEHREQSRASMMPEGQFEKLTNEEIRDLIVYLRSSGQVSLPRENGVPGELR